MEEFPAEQRVGLATTLLQPDSGHRPGSALAVDLWQQIEDLVAVGTTILLTTRYWRKPTGSPTGSEAPACSPSWSATPRRRWAG